MGKLQNRLEFQGLCSSVSIESGNVLQHVHVCDGELWEQHRELA